ncbi:hypothetical protein [Bacillus multifaciens]|uniref:hypothetical protein n=1 Tax=Bacillus multifaciens TaxID=3068506 RepID=UPI0027423452|nr:hypothetical protein [Bacillus sp. WLY-B-L8]MDP7980474.1 hypothetical protein [Bacillus sp. WLY-B-L8]
MIVLLVDNDQIKNVSTHITKIKSSPVVCSFENQKAGTKEKIIFASDFELLMLEDGTDYKNMNINEIRAIAKMKQEFAIKSKTEQLEDLHVYIDELKKQIQIQRAMREELMSKTRVQLGLLLEKIFEKKATDKLNQNESEVKN